MPSQLAAITVPIFTNPWIDKGILIFLSAAQISSKLVSHMLAKPPLPAPLNLQTVQAPLLGNLPYILVFLDPQSP